MNLSGLHLLLTYRCNLACDHCFVWGGPEQTGTMTLACIRRILEEAKSVRTVEWIYFEGGESFLYYPVLVEGVREASRMGFQVGIISNGYWATDEENAASWLAPLAGPVRLLAISSDLYHGEGNGSRAKNARIAAAHLGIPFRLIAVAPPAAADAPPFPDRSPDDGTDVMYRGRAAEKLASGALRSPWSELTECPFEDLRDPGRLHVDPLGNVHLCQGISLGNLFRASLADICNGYDPASHPILGPLLAGGPAELVLRHRLPPEERYADACHLCYQARKALRDRYPDILLPDQMYGITGNGAAP